MEDARDSSTQRALKLWPSSRMLRRGPKLGEDRVGLLQRCTTTRRPSRTRREASGSLADMLYYADVGPKCRGQLVITQVSD
eukprot:2694743-Pyramimonas_sp.AAC.1